MRLDKLDLNLFVVFDALYQDRSVTRAAERLHLTQPAVSNALARLRQQFDDQLFVRSPSGMLPTPVAEGIIQDVRKALALLGRSLTNNAKFDPANASKTLRVGIHDSLAPMVLPVIAQELHHKAPSIDLHSYYRDRANAVEALKSGDLDVLLDSPAVNAKELRQQPLGESHYVVAMRKGHSLAKRKLDVEAFIKSKHVHVSSRAKGRGQVDIALNALGLKRSISARMQQHQPAADITANSDALWTTPLILLKGTTLIHKPLPFEVPPLSWNLYWHLSAEEDPASQWLRKTIANACSTLLQQH
ncbi:LysR family transcriptional regulator [Halioxenophilus aromaticivorans]|uniref:LysR family transcriptional regulator n=1 Tax=Halioxenophilus aromaticivorans TaxID=1306992 RepID=A0AAV3U6D3_9ALTE